MSILMSPLPLCCMPIISCGGRSAMLLDEEDDVDDSRRACCATCDVGSGCER